MWGLRINTNITFQLVLCLRGTETLIVSELYKINYDHRNLYSWIKVNKGLSGCDLIKRKAKRSYLNK